MVRRGQAARIALPVAIVAIATSVGACASRGEPAQPDEFTSTPSACKLVGPQKARELAGAAKGKSRAHTETNDACRWSTNPAEAPRGPAQASTAQGRNLSVSVFLHNAPVGQDDVSGTALAKKDFGAQRKKERVSKKRSIRGVGDEAYGRFTDHDGRMKLRNGNITVDLNYAGPAPRGSAGSGEKAIRKELVNTAKEVNANLEK